jgi:hypothetical protein
MAARSTTPCSLPATDCALAASSWKSPDDPRGLPIGASVLPSPCPYTLISSANFGSEPLVNPRNSWTACGPSCKTSNGGSDKPVGGTQRTNGPRFVERDSLQEQLRESTDAAVNATRTCSTSS